MRHFLANNDQKLMNRLNRWYPPAWFRIWMLGASRGGDGWLWYAMLLLLALFGGGDRFRAVSAAVISTGAGVGIFVLVKQLFRRKRPCDLGPHAWAHLLPPDQFSFPSGHTITAFSMATSLMKFYPDLTGILLFCAISIALSRLMLGMHFLTDVLAGAAIGIGLGYTGFILCA